MWVVISMAQFKRRERKHRKRAKVESNNIVDSNTDEILPLQEGSKQQKHDIVREEFQQTGASGKKRKRLEKYIENKLRKEHNLELLKKLAGGKVDTSLFQSSKNLGKQTISKRDALAQALKHQRAGISTTEDHQLLYEPVNSATGNKIPVPPQRFSWLEISETVPQEKQKDESPPIVLIGTGLKRPLEIDDKGNPVIQKRKRLNRPQIILDEPLWDGFSPEDSSQSLLEDSASSSEQEYSESDDRSGDSDTESIESGCYPLFTLPVTPSEQTKVRVKVRKSSDFKTWAVQQVNKAKDFTPSTNTFVTTDVQAVSPKLYRPRPKEEDPLPQELQISLEPSLRKIHSIHVNRLEAIQESRIKLPIFAEEQRIMEAIHNNSAVIVCGATGSGKTTQVPQFLFEAGYGDPEGPTPGMIGVTQPRRVAAVTMAKRVGEELGNKVKSSYQIRFDSTVDSQTAIKFMTDGILLREVSQDFALSKYSIIVIDEVHERSVNTDILIGMISRVVDLRNKLSQTDTSFRPLKLIIMSATLMVDSFLNNSRLFPQGRPLLVESEGRQYPVTMHFSRRTCQDYVEEAFQKVIRGHRKLPPGGMLIFLTGQKEINDLAKKLREVLPSNSISPSHMRVKINAKEAPLEADDLDLVEHAADALEINEDESGDDEGDGEFEIDDTEAINQKALILPLYSQLPIKEQLHVFDPPPDNTRLIILATNVAETSITIPGIRYVFDTGRSKEKKYDKITGVQSFEIGWISKASALQRAGRAGRTGPGHCYRFYSSAMYERDFPEHTVPEILRMPIEGVVLQLKSMDLSNTINFPFPTSPDRHDIARAEKLLAYLGGLDRDGKITPLGRDLSLYPTSPRFAKMLSIGHQHNSIYLVTAMVAALAVPELFITQARLLHTAQNDEDMYNQHASTEHGRKKAYNQAHATFSAHDPSSDALKLTTALCAYMWSSDQDNFCKNMVLQQKAMKEAQSLYSQLLNIIALNLPGSVDSSKTKLQPPNKTQVAALKQIAAAGFLDQVAIRADLGPSPPEMPRKPSRSIDVPYLTLFPTHTGRTEDALSQIVFVHPSSILAHTTSSKNMPQYLIYSHIQSGNTATIAGSKSPKIWMYPLTAVTGVQLASLAKNTPLLEYGKPIGKVEVVDREVGQHNGRIAWCVPSLVGECGGRVWPLPAVKVLQRRDGKGVWNVEKVLS